MLVVVIVDAGCCYCWLLLLLILVVIAGCCHC